MIFTPQPPLPPPTEEYRPVAAPSICGFYPLELDRRTGRAGLIIIMNRRMSTYMCSQAGTAHKECPRLYPENSSRKPWKHQLQFHCCRLYLHCLPEDGYPNSSFQSGYLFTTCKQKKCQANSFYVRVENSNLLLKLFKNHNLN